MEAVDGIGGLCSLLRVRLDGPFLVKQRKKKM